MVHSHPNCSSLAFKKTDVAQIMAICELGANSVVIKDSSVTNHCTEYNKYKSKLLKVQAHLFPLHLY